MATKKISQLSPASSLTGAELIPMVQAGTTLAGTVSQIAAKAAELVAVPAGVVLAGELASPAAGEGAEMVGYTSPATDFNTTVGTYLDSLHSAGGSVLVGTASGSNLQQTIDNLLLASAATLRTDLNSPLATNGSALLNHLPTHSGALAQNLRAILSRGVAVTMFATEAQLAVDATAATQLAIGAAIAENLPGVYFPGGVTYHYPAASASIDPGTGTLEFYGDGAASLISFEEGTGAGDITTMRKCLFRNLAATAKGTLTFRGLRFRGQWEEKAWAEGGGCVLFLDHYAGIELHNCRFENLSWMAMANEWIGRVRVTGCTFDKVCRDMVRFRSSSNVQIIGNSFARGDDDAIALHSNLSATGADQREGIIVSGNVLEDVSGIQILAGRMVDVSNNILRRCKLSGIFVYTAAGVAAEAPHSVFGVNICNNQIYDHMIRAPFATAVSQAIAVYSIAAQGSVATSSVKPGQRNGGSGVFVLPWNHRSGRYAESDAVAAVSWVRVANNTIARTLPAVAAYSTWGYGLTYGATGPTDPAVTDVALRPSTGIQLDGELRDGLCFGNIITHTVNPIGFTAGLDDYSLLNVSVSRNSASDFTGSFVSIPNPAAVVTTGLSITDNDIDGDPYFLSTNRVGTAGSYTGGWTADTVPCCLTAVSYYGILFARNRIKNVARILNNSGSANIDLRDNFLRCDPTTVGFSTSNLGIGNVINAGAQAIYEIVGCAPLGAGFNELKNVQAQTAGAKPTAGTYVVGAFVQSVTGSTVHGWHRLTTGTGHVAGTDWKTVVLT